MMCYYLSIRHELKFSTIFVLDYILTFERYKLYGLQSSQYLRPIFNIFSDFRISYEIKIKNRSNF